MGIVFENFHFGQLMISFWSKNVVSNISNVSRIKRAAQGMPCYLCVIDNESIKHIILSNAVRHRIDFERFLMMFDAIFI